MFRKRIYLDYASITPIDPRVLRIMRRFSSVRYANPSSWYKEGIEAKNALEDSRKSVASAIHAHPDEIVFTGGGTEANLTALKGAFEAFRDKHLTDGEKPHLIISSIEHSSIIEAANDLERRGCEVTRLAADPSGVVSVGDLKKAIRPSTFLVSIMTVNNEIGTVQPIREIVKIVRHYKKNVQYPMSNKQYPLFHTDAAQAIKTEDLNVEKLGVDLMTMDGSKIYGPRGVGALYIRRGTSIGPIMIGGGQEHGMRSGTENLPAIAGFAKALELATIKKTDKFRDMMIAGLLKIRADIKVNGSVSGTSPHILNVSIPGIDNEFFVLQLDANGIACSTKSSCLRDEDESYVLKAIGGNSKEAIRFSFGRWTKKRDIRRALHIIEKLLKRQQFAHSMII